MPLAFNPITAEFDYISPDLTLNALRVKGGGGTSYSGYPAAFAVETDPNLYWQLVIADNTATTDHFGIYGFVNGVFGFQSEQYLTTGTSCTLSPEGIIAESNSRGTGAVPGKMVWAGRNMSGGGAAGVLGLYSKSGVAKYFWFDNSGNPRMHTARPTEDGSVSDTAGVQLATLVTPTFTAPVILNEAIGSSALTINGATQTASFPALNITQTWNNAAVTFTAAKVNVTNTASSAGSLLLDLQVASTSKLSVDKTGIITTNGGLTINGGSGYGIYLGTGTESVFVLCSSNYIGFSTGSASTSSARLYGNTAHTLAQRNGTNAQTFNIYNTYTDASNGEWFSLGWTSSTAIFKMMKNGTGIARDMEFQVPATSAIYFDADTHQYRTAGFGNIAKFTSAGLTMQGTAIITDTTTGTKFCTSASQKLGFWNATPIVQPTTAIAAATRVGGGGTALTDTDTFDGYTMAQVVKALRNMGILA